ncbi:hypothetical protein GZ78_14090 [Endozoicomonas numazuensis]|uniref:Uncharacterized protein n=2 Tax=Endozoicomonas numazuensis TaxID=1137799 RepID=A0A081NF10_9GAMM|nr:hypothetical protein GZ78_14090 [Endozoicomonas numazuensis]
MGMGMGMGMESAGSTHVYDRARNWRDQLIKLDVTDLKENVGVTPGGREVLVLKESENRGWLSYIPFNPWNSRRTQDNGASNSMLSDIQLMQRRASQLNDMYLLNTEEGSEPQNQSITTGKQYLHVLQDLMGSQAGQMLLMESTLEGLLQTLSEPEGVAHVADELQHCLTRYLSASRRQNEDTADSLTKMQTLLYNWIDEQSNQVNSDSARRALDQINKEVQSLFESYGKALDVHESLVANSVSNHLFVASEAVAPETRIVQSTQISETSTQPASKESFFQELQAVMRSSEGMIQRMNIPEKYPNGRQMLLDDLEIAKEALKEELHSQEMSPAALQSWYTASRQRLLKMQDTMYLAVRSPDRPPASYPARRGLYNRYRDCPFNSHAQALAHSGWSDYFLHRFLPSVPLPGPKPVVDQSQLENMEAAITKNSQQKAELSERLTSINTAIKSYDEQIETINVKMRALPKPAELRDHSQTERQKSMNERFALANQKQEPTEKRGQLLLEKKSLEAEEIRIHEESRSLANEQRTARRQFDTDRRERQSTWDRANNQYQDYLRKLSLQTSWLQILEQLRDTRRHDATSLAPAYDTHQQIEGIDNHYGGIVPMEYSLNETLLDPRNEQSRRTFNENECGLYKWGGHDHWTFLIVNEHGEVDRINDSQCTRSKFASKQAMLDYFSEPGRYIKEQLTAVHS